MKKEFNSKMPTKEISKETNILSNEFWNAFERDLYPSHITSKLSRNFLDYEKVIAGKAYIASLNKGKYKINILSIKDNFFITITTKGREQKICGLLHYDLKLKKNEASYYKVSIRKNHPEALKIIDKLIRELNKKVKIERRELLRGGIASSRPIKKLVISALWKNLILENSVFSLTEKAKFIGDKVGLDPITVAGYSVQSNYKEVQEEARQARKILTKCKYEVPDETSTVERKKSPYSLKLTKELVKVYNELLNIKDVQKYWLKKYKYKIPASTIYGKVRKFKNWEKNVDEIKDKTKRDSKQILPVGFWNAFKQGVYYPEIRLDVAFHIEDYAEILEGLGYTRTVYRSNYVINIIAIKDAFFISLHSKGPDSKELGIINYNSCPTKHGKKHELKYIESFMNFEHPIGLMLLNKIRRELFNNHIEVDDNPILSGTLPFKKPIKTIIITAKWIELKRGNPNQPLPEIAEQIALLIGLDPISVGFYGGNSPLKSVRTDTAKASFKLLEQMHDITNLWLEYLDKYPAFLPSEIAEKISLRTNLDPISVVGYGKFSEILLVKSQATIAFTPLMEQKHNITSKWLDLKIEIPSISSEEIVENLALDLDLSPISVAGYGRGSKDPSIRYESSKIYNGIMEKNLNITDLWIQIKVSNPNLSTEEIARKVAMKTGKSSITIASYGRSSHNKSVKSDATNAYKKLMMEKLQITVKWVKFRNSNPRLAPVQIAIRIAQLLDKSPISIASYGICSDNEIVKEEAAKAEYALRKKDN